VLQEIGREHGECECVSQMFLGDHSEQPGDECNLPVVRQPKTIGETNGQYAKQYALLKKQMQTYMGHPPLKKDSGCPRW
jgi:hypothetical protein